MEVLRRYVEQLETTIETMRRRCIAIYDGTIRLGKRISRLIDGLREVTEPIAYDVKEVVTAAMEDMSSLDPNEMDIRNNLLELYLGCSILTIGLSAGEVTGAFVLGPLYGCIFDWWWEILLVLILPYYVYLTFRKNAALDEMERRVNLFWLAMCIGSFMGHLLGNRLVSTMPAVVFIQPLVLGLAIDTELSPPSIYSDRSRLLGIACGMGVMLAALLLFICGFSLCSVTTLLLQAAFLFAHFQVVYYCIKNKIYGTGEAQLCYVIGTLLLHIIIGGVLGSSATTMHSGGA